MRSTSGLFEDVHKGGHDEFDADPKRRTRCRSRRTQARTVVQRDAPRRGGAVLRLMAVRKADGTATTYAVHVRKVNGKKTSERGASEQHATFDRAKTALSKLMTAAGARGWVKGERRGGFTPRPDAFSISSLPAAAAEKAGKGGRK